MTYSTRQRDSDDPAGDPPGNPAADPALAQRILDVELVLGEQHGWDDLHLYQIAQAVGITLANVRRHYDQKDALTDITNTLKEIKRIPMKKPSGKYNVWNKTRYSEGTSH